MIEKVKRYIEKYHMIAEQDTIVVGVSGGADSVCLLLVLLELQKEQNYTIQVVHVNHLIRKDAAEDAAYVKKLCESRNIPFTLVESDVRALAAQQMISEEEMGRKIRYEAFRSVLEQTASRQGKIAVAHNCNDRAETMLFHLFRGTGLTGASGIRPVNDSIIRPLLCVERAEIEEYLRKQGISYCMDSTNAEDAYTRNRIRHHILPFAEKEICRGAISHLSEAADNLLGAEEYIARQAKQEYEKCVEELDEGRLRIQTEQLKSADEYLQGRVLLLGMEKLTPHRKDITQIHIRKLQELLTKEGSRQISLPYQLTAVKEYEYLTLYRKSAGEKNVQTMQEEFLAMIPGSLMIPGLGEVDFTKLSYQESAKIPQKTYTKWFDYDKIATNLVFRTRKTGDYLTINQSLSRKSLQDYMVNEKIPKAQRDSMYVLADGSHIVWVPGYRISENYKVKEGTQNIIQVQVREESSCEKGVICNG